MSDPVRSAPDFYITLRLRELTTLVDAFGAIPQLTAENAQLRREVNALRSQYSELLIAFGDLRREVKKG